MPRWAATCMIASAALVACGGSSGVEQAEYDALAAENEALVAENNELQAQLDEAAATTTLPEPETEALTGTFTLVDSDVTGPWDGCRGRGGYDDFGSDMNVTIRDGSGQIVGTGSTRSLSEADTTSDNAFFSAVATEERDDEGSFDVTCVVVFETEVGSTDFYEIEIGSRGGLSYSRSELQAAGWHIELSLG